MARFRIQPHVRLQEWVAEEEGFFRDEGLDYEFEPQGLAAASLTTSSVQPADAAPLTARTGALEDINPRVIKSEIDAAYKATLAALSERVEKILDDIAKALEDNLATIRGELQKFLEGVEQTLNVADQSAKNSSRSRYDVTLRSGLSE